MDGSVIFERKIVSYPGLTFRYPLHNNFVVSKIELTSDNYFLRIGDLKLQVGMPIKEIADILPDANRSKKDGLLSINVAEANSIKALKKGRNSDVSIGFKDLNIEYDPDTDKITKISISIRYT